MDDETRTRLDSLLRRQHGLVTRQQVTALGVPTRTATSLLHRSFSQVHAGVWQSRSTVSTRCSAPMAAALSLHPAGVAPWPVAVTGAWALRAWRLELPEVAAAGTVTLLRGPGAGGGCPAGTERTGVRVRRQATAPTVCDVDGVPTVPRPRAMADLVRGLSPRVGDLAVDAALQQEAVTLGALQDEVAAGGGTRGNARLREAVGRADPSLHSVAERHVLMVTGLMDVGVRQLPVYDRDGLIGIADWGDPDIRALVEVNGYACHGGAERFLQDHRRRRRLAAEGWQLLEIAAIDGWHRSAGLRTDVQAFLDRARRLAAAA